MRGPLMMVAVNAPEGMPGLATPGLRFAPFYTVRGETLHDIFPEANGVRRRSLRPRIVAAIR